MRFKACYISYNRFPKLLQTERISPRMSCFNTTDQFTEMHTAEILDSFTSEERSNPCLIDEGVGKTNLGR